jgi:hypothetical protein
LRCFADDVHVEPGNSVYYVKDKFK